MANARDIERAVAVLRSGGLVAMPTETVYGLAADAENPAAVARIFAAKQRPSTHPLIVHIASGDVLGRWVSRVPAFAQLLADRFWPGPLTLILPRGTRVPLAVTGGQETVAIRVPNHPVAQALLREFGGGAAAPSANRFGSVSPTTAEHVRAGLGDAVDVILDGGPCRVGVESTIVDVTGPRPVILRPGGVTREDLADVLGFVPDVPATSTVRVSGQHPSHYAPRARVTLVRQDVLAQRVAAAHAEGQHVGALMPTGRIADVPDARLVIGVPADATDYARLLYQALREFDEAGCDVIMATLPAESGMGLAVADRLRHAAGPR